MDKGEIYEIIKKRFGTTDEDLQDLGTIMDALDGIEKADYLEQEIANQKIEYEKKLSDLDQAWRDRYRERFFNGEADVSDLIEKMEEKQEKDEETEEISIDEYLDRLDEKGNFK